MEIKGRYIVAFNLIIERYKKRPLWKVLDNTLENTHDVGKYYIAL